MAPAAARRPGRRALAVTLPTGMAIAAVILGLPATAAGGDGRLTLLHTNDIHGGYALRAAHWLEGRPQVGGFRTLSGTVEAIRTEADVLLVDAGDLMSGDPLTIIDYRGVMGGGAMAFMNAVGYDAMALGNHEFDNGRREAEALLGMAEFPVLSANLWIEETGERFAPAAHTLVERGGVRVAIIGLILDDLAGVVASEPIRGLRVEPMIEAARREVAELDPGSDLIVVVAHEGLDGCRRLARDVPGIDVIIAGHDHRRTTEPIVENGVLIVESGKSLANLGRLDLRVAADGIAEHRYELLLLGAPAVAAARPAVQSVHEACHAAVQAEYGVRIATLLTPFERTSQGESNVGNWVTDAFRETAGTDFAVTNSSGLRADLEAGPLTRLDIHRLMPFRNVLCTFRCSGRELAGFASHNTRAALEGGRSTVQMSGLSYAFDERGAIHDLRIGGEPVDPGGTYSGATSDFVLFSQAEKYLGFVPVERQRTTVMITDLLGEAAARQGRIDARVEGRFRKLAPEPMAAEPIVVGE